MTRPFLHCAFNLSRFGRILIVTALTVTFLGIRKLLLKGWNSEGTILQVTVLCFWGHLHNLK